MIGIFKNFGNKIENSTKGVSEPYRFRRLIAIESPTVQNLSSGDKIQISIPGLILSTEVEGDNKRLYVKRSREPGGKLYLDQFEERGYIIESAHRYVEDCSNTYTPKLVEIDSGRPGVKPGSRASIENAIESAEAITAYFENRIAMGDPLFDQWMVDALDASREASKNLKKIVKAMYKEEE